MRRFQILFSISRLAGAYKQNENKERSTIFFLPSESATIASERDRQGCALPEYHVLRGCIAQCIRRGFQDGSKRERDR
jgi:hypothetical protein